MFTQWTPKLVICVYVFNVNLTDSFDGQTVSMPFDRMIVLAHTDTNPKNLELAPPPVHHGHQVRPVSFIARIITFRFFQDSKIIARSEKRNLHPARSESLGVCHYATRATYNIYQHSFPYIVQNDWKKSFDNVTINSEGSQ